MTREEREQALEWFKNRPVTMPGAKKMYDLAFEALSADGDTISRQAAIDAIGGNKAVGDPSQMDEDEVIKMWERIRIINVLNHLPSAQPETHEERTETHACDCISRQKAIDAVHKNYDVILDFTSDGQTISSSIEDILSDLPPVQPERKKGKWINIRHDNIAECDQCGITGRAWMNFCFDCGVDMREETK